MLPAGDLVLYNDMQTNHMHCPSAAGNKTYAGMVLTYDPYIQSMWVTSPCGHLLFNNRIVTAETYRRVWAESVGW